MPKTIAQQSSAIPISVLLRALQVADADTIPDSWIAKLRRTSGNMALSVALIVAGGFGLISLTIPPATDPPSTAVTAPNVVSPTPYSLPRSIPVHIEIPDIGVSTDLVKLDKNDDGALQTPSDYTHAGWYEHSPTPGEVGPSIITGHVDNYLGPAVFFYLKDLRSGQLIHVTREDGMIATFSVDDVKVFDQNNFPTDEVYGDIDYAGIRLITCGGIYNPLTNHYSHNTVVYASLVEN